MGETSLKNLSTKQLLIIVSAVVCSIVLVALFMLTYLPEFMVPGEELALYLSPLIIAGLIALPTTLFIKIGWPEKITAQTLLLPLRLIMAYEFLHGGIHKVLDPLYTASSGLIGFGMVAGPTPFIVAVMTFLNTNYVLFLLLIAWGEVLVGISMLTGGFTRLGAIGGMSMQLAFFFLLGWLSASTFGANMIGAFAWAVIGYYRPGRVLGVDAVWGEKLENSKNAILRFLGSLT